jgi:hypothetical protein
MTSLPGQNRIVNGINNHQRRSIIDFEHASRFLQSRRRVVKLLITLGKQKKTIFFLFKNQIFLIV